MQKAIFHYPSVKGCRADQGYRGTFKEILENFYDIKVEFLNKSKENLKYIHLDGK